MLRVHAQQFGVALSRFLKHFQFKLNLRFGREGLQARIAGLQHALDLLERLLKLPLQMQGNRLAQTGRLRGRTIGSVRFDLAHDLVETSVLDVDSVGRQVSA